jgi:hypothetical protein
MMSHVKVAEINERVVGMASCRSTQRQRNTPYRASRYAAVIAMARVWHGHKIEAAA